MRMVDVTVTAILGIMIVIIGSYTAQAALYSFVSSTNSTLRAEIAGNADALSAWDLVTGRVVNSALIWGVLTIFGFLLWWVMSVMKRDEVTGAYYQ